MDILKSISIEGFKSIRNLDCLELGPINVLIGPNGAGKSNFVSFFQLLNYAMTEGMQTYVSTRGFANSFLHLGSKMTHRIHAELEFQVETGINRYCFTLVPAARDSLIFSEEKVFFQAEGHPHPIECELDPGSKESNLPKATSPPLNANELRTARAILSQLMRKRVYQFHDTSLESRLRKATHLDDNRYLRSDGGNLSAILFRLQRDKSDFYRRIILQLRRMIPSFQDFVLEPEGDHILLQWRGTDPEYIFGPHQLSDGSLRLMALTTLFLQPPEDLPDMVIVDEPELGLHPEAEALLAGMIRSVSAKCQVLLATQSASLVDNFEPEDVIVCELQDGASDFRRPTMEELQVWLEDYTLGEVWRKNVMGGQP
ncbi:Predicted ATPase [Desulfatibacillum alkenivorans DSM 16219]|jgi:predicted ATPase|uniref:Predicted ATPase n=1 Tax=Desulfatibacillum alkenivorans DSM 16219 TaxID=1121393 RepID=A0A1M6N5X6_9BACT|nr:AAA family ATPase [Desulfatibacillum alkenivorans]SHJ91070.1 Predicted ATPase [Desulfatibacillum alkenivorans DSM 16219]